MIDDMQLTASLVESVGQSLITFSQLQQLDSRGQLLVANPVI